MKRAIRLAMVGALALSLSLLARDARAQENLEIEIGPPSNGVAKHSHDHDITVESLKEKKTAYTLTSKPEDSHRITLTKEQAADVVDGTTVMVQTSTDKGHQHRVSITLKPEEESSGW